MDNRNILIASKRRILKTVSLIAPLVSGIIWGGFWVRAIGSIEDIYSGVLGILLAFAVGRAFSRLPGSAVGRLGFWYVASCSYLENHWLLPVAFYFGLSETLLRRRNWAGRFVCGLVSGILLGWRFDFSAISLLLSGVSLLFYANREHRKKFVAGKFRLIASWIFNCAAVVAALIMVFYPERVYSIQKKQNESALTPATWITSIGLSGKSAPEILLVSRKTPCVESAFEQLLASRIHVLLPGISGNKKYDVVIIEHLPALMRMPERILNLLAPGGVLVMPVEWCSLLPNLHWQTLPGDGGIFCAAIPDKTAPLEISGEVVEKNLMKIISEIKEYSTSPIPLGAISGAMVDFKSTEPVLEPGTAIVQDGSSRILWGGVILLILLESFWHSRKIGEFIPPVIAAALFALSVALLIGNNEISGTLHGETVLFGIAVLPLWIRIPFKERILRGISILASAALGVWIFYPGFFTALPALVLAALNFSGCRSRFQSDKALLSDWQDFCVLLMLAGAFWFGGTIKYDAVSVILAICSLKLWLQLRS